MVGPDDRHLSQMRVEYGSVEKDGSPDLDTDWLADGWLALFRRWIDDAERAGLAEPNAMVLATVADGRPVSRTVLCKSADETGITFFTNYDSAKGAELASTPFASATFPWFRLGRQVHIRGPVSRVEPQATADYWARRPRGSPLGAWASQQSRPLESRFALEKAVAAHALKFGVGEIPRPPHWTGFRIAPIYMEFWRDGAFRLHDRIVFRRASPGEAWTKTRLYP